MISAARSESRDFEDARLDVRFHFGKRFGGGFGVHRFDDGLALFGSEMLHDVGQIGRMHGLERLVPDIQPQPALRVRLDDVAELPTNGVGRDRPLQPPHHARRQQTLRQTAEDGAEADVDLENLQQIAAFFVVNLERYVRHPHYFAAVRVDDLLVEQVAHHSQHVFVGVIGRELLILEIDALQRDFLDLVVADGEPRPASAYEVAVDADGVDERNQRGVFDTADLAATGVVDVEPHELGAEEQWWCCVLRRHGGPSVIAILPSESRSPPPGWPGRVMPS